jgi:hypothetical protein
VILFNFTVLDKKLLWLLVPGVKKLRNASKYSDNESARNKLLRSASTPFDYTYFTLTTRWFKYDRDKLWLVYTQIVPVIFEPPCTWSTVFPGKLTGPQLVKKSPALYWTRRFIAVSTRAHQKSNLWGKSILSMPPSHFSNMHFNIIIPSTLGSYKWFLPSGFPTKIP